MQELTEDVPAAQEAAAFASVILVRRGRMRRQDMRRSHDPGRQRHVFCLCGLNIDNDVWGVRQRFGVALSWEGDIGRGLRPSDGPGSILPENIFVASLAG